MATPTIQLMTTADLLALPDDGKQRWLIRGELRENGMTRRNRFHSMCMANVTTALNIWRYGLPRPWGEVICGEAGVRLPGEPQTTVGVDVAYVPPEVAIRQGESTTMIEGVPALIVEIVSPSNRAEDVTEKIEAYLAAGVSLVWEIDPRRRTVTIFRPGDEPTLVNVRQELSGGDVLPGFRVPVARLFE